MKQGSIKIVLFLFFFPAVMFAQFGKNKVQYKDYNWYFIQITLIFTSVKTVKRLQSSLQKLQRIR